MFYYAEKFNQPIGTWDISKLECKNDMFIGAKSYSYLRKELNEKSKY